MAWVVQYEATPEFLAAADRVRQMYGAVMTGVIRQHHAVGRYVQGIRDDPAYGRNVVKNLAVVLGWACETLHLDLHLAETYSDAEIDALCELRMADGRPLAYRHLMHLCVIPAGRRQEVPDRVLAESWTVRELEAYIVREHERAGGGKPCRGRPLKAPRDFAGVVAQQAGYAREFVERNARVWATAEHGLGAKAAGLGPDQVTPERVEAVRRLAADLRVVAAEAARRAGEAEAVHRRLAEVVGRRERAAKPVEALIAPSDTAPTLVDGGPAVALPPFPTLPVVPPADAGSTPVGIERLPSGAAVELPARDDPEIADETSDRSVAV